MAVTSFDGQFSFKQDSLARLGQRENTKMNAEQYQAFQNSPFMQSVRKCDDLTWTFTCTRDQKRAETDPSFKPVDEDFQAPKAHSYDRGIDYYKVLGIDDYAPLDEVKKAYKKLSLVYHPDKTAGLTPEQKEEYAGIFIELKNAYLTLGDQATRRQYDRDRDRDQASFQLNGWKPKKRAHFDASEMLKKLQEMKKPPGKTVDVNVSAKLEKFFYGAHKKITRMRRVKDFMGFTTENRTYRVDIPRGAREPHECAFRRQGDHHEETSPDTVNFIIACKPHNVVERRADDLLCKSVIYLGTEALTKSYLTAEAPSVRGRHLLLWGRNPFYSVAGVAGGNLRVRVRGEGMTQDGSYKFMCRLGTAPSDAVAAAAYSGGGSAPSRGPAAGAGVTPSNGATSGDDKVVVMIRHMQTEGKVWLRVSKNFTMADIRQKLVTVLGLPRGSTVRLLQQVPGGFSPYPDRQLLLNLTKLNAAGTAWEKVTLDVGKSTQLLRRLVAVVESDSFQANLAQVRKMIMEAPFNGWKAMEALAVGMLASVLPDFGCEPSGNALRACVDETRKLAAGRPDLLALIAKVDGVFQVDEAPSGGQAGSGRAKRRPMKRFLLQHRLGPPGGLTGTGSETEEEELEAAAAAGGSAGGLAPSAAPAKPAAPAPAPAPRPAAPAAKHGEGGLCEAPAMRRRVTRRGTKGDRLCEVELAQVGEPIRLFTRPSCTITLYSNAGQSMTTRPGDVPPRQLFAISISSPSCAKKGAIRDWEFLRSRLVPVLFASGFLLLQAARSILPRSLAAAPACAVAEEEDEAADAEFVAVHDGALDLAACCEVLLPDGGEKQESLQRCQIACEERREFLRRRAPIERRLAASAHLPAAWKSLGDDAFKRGDFFTAVALYSKRLEDLRKPPDGEAAASPDGGAFSDNNEASVVLSNRAAGLAKVRDFQASLDDAREAFILRPNWGRAWGRIGLASASLNQLQDAIDAYLQAVTFDPTPAHVEALAGVVARRGTDPDAAHAAKETGNGAMRTGEFGMAVAHFTYCLALLPPDPRVSNPDNADEHAFLRSVLYSNRAAAFSRLKAWAPALADAKLAVKAKEDFPKAHCRLGTAMLGHGLTEPAYAEFARALQIEGQDQTALKGRQACMSMLPWWNSSDARRRLRDRFGMDLGRPAGSTKVYAISDVHFDHKCNEEWAHRIDDFKFQEDVLIVAGNMCDTRNALQRALTTFKAKFRRVFYVPGNHECWVHPGEQTKFPDSFAKLLSIFQLCDELGVDIFPAAVAQDVFIVPLLSWYSAEFDADDPFPDPNSTVDQHCRWPIADVQVWRYMLKLNSAHLNHLYHGTVVSFSHFLPHLGLPFPSYGKMAKTMGCEPLDEQVRTIKGKNRVHVYGHSHVHHAKFHNGLMYINHAHGEDGGKEDRAPLLLIYDGKQVAKREEQIYDGPKRV